ncbi:MAG: flagella basal body P-ring formation protein FlgA [Hydrogenophilales bacterium 28-61-23]|nr:MAG: flagella basal body P-ring formation protein FlgA [Hydrogenophilales bacterium 28-61-23]
MRAIFPFFLFVSIVLGVSCPAQGAANGALLDVPRLRVQAAAWLEQKATAAFPGSVAQAKIGDIDARLRLPACADTRFFLPANAQLWGRGNLGVRCEAPAQWTFYLGYQNRLSGLALVATRPIANREAPAGTDVELRQIEYTQSPDLYPRTLPADVRVNRPVAAGQAIAIGWLSLPNVIQAGRKVRLQARTAAFTIHQEGTALNAAAPGELVRVKTPGGRIVQGTAMQDGTVEVRP